MLNYLPAYVQLHFHRLREWSINKDEQICVPCPIIASCRHNHPGRVTKTQAALTPVVLHLSVHPSQFTPLFLLVPIKTKCQMEVGKKHLWKQKKKISRTAMVFWSCAMLCTMLTRHQKSDSLKTTVIISHFWSKGSMKCSLLATIL